MFFAALLGSALSRDVRESLDAARAARDRARELLRRLIRTEEEERRRIAADLHDRMGARMFELHYGIDRVQDALQDAKPEVQAQLARLAAGARDCGDEVRELMNTLRPSVLDDFGIGEALRELAHSLDESGELRVRVDIDAGARATRPEVNIALFRIAQEAVLNARKHARASELRIALRLGASDSLVLSVCDDGGGFDPELPVRGHLGVSTMRERAEDCGGTLEIASAPGQGTELRVTVPAGVRE
jgi:signal transduction histidine kinase